MNTILAIEQNFFEYLADQMTIHDIPDLEQLEARDRSTEDVLSVGTDGNATIQITGPLSMNGPSGILKFLGIGGTSYRSIIQAANEAAEDDDIETVRLIVNSPGGDIAGVDETWSALMALSEKKKVIAENHGIIASAAYWLASAADEIVAMSPTSQTGAIGVIITQMDSEKKVKVVSSNAPNKATDANTKAGRQVIQERADALERIFISRVAEGRGVSEETVRTKFGRGGVLVAEDPDKTKPDAISVGLIDSLTKTESRGKRKRASASGVGVQSATEPKNGDCQIQEDVFMKLDEIFAKHPELRAEVQALVDSAVQDAVAKENQKAVKVASYLKAPEYAHEKFTALACNVLEGTSEIASLEGAIVAFDMLKAGEKQEAAEKEEPEETKSEIVPPVKKSDVLETGVCMTNEDLDALIEDEEKAGV
jgi:ClpP class serine protease